MCINEDGFAVRYSGLMTENCGQRFLYAQHFVDYWIGVESLILSFDRKVPNDPQR